MHYFVSDLHLGARYVADARAHERRVCAFLDSIAADAESLYLLGDVLDYWFEYRHVVPRGHVRFFGRLAALADAGVRIVWLTGNHDVWLRDYLRDEVGLTVLHGHTVVDVGGRRLLVSHGDDVGRQPAMYRFTRWCFYNPVCQWLYAAIHPRWTTAVARGWSTSNRTTRRPDPSRPGRALERLAEFATAHSRTHADVDAYLFGHLHVAEQRTLPTGAQMLCLGDWLTLDTYATLDGGRLALHHFNPAEP